MAKGTYSAKVAITFGQELIGKINAVADRDGTSFAEAVRRICRAHFDMIEG